MLRTVDEMAWDDAFLQDAAILVDVLEEHVQRGEPLNQPALDRLPFVRRDDARQQIVGKDALGALVVAVDREGHALMQERAVGILLAVAQIRRRQLEQAAMQRLVRLARLARSIEHLVVAVVECVSENRPSRPRTAPSGPITAHPTARAARWNFVNRNVAALHETEQCC